MKATNTKPETAETEARPQAQTSRGYCEGNVSRIVAAIADGTARPDSVFNDWDVNTILAGFAREIIAGAEDNIPDTRALCSMLAVIAESMIVSPCDFLIAERKRTTIQSDTQRAVKPLPELEEMPEKVIIRAARALVDAGALKYKAAALALLHAFHCEAADVIALEQCSFRVGDDNGK